MTGYLKKLPDEAFTLKQATEKGVTFYQISKLVSSGDLEKIGPGIYQKSSEDILVDGFDTTLFREVTARVGFQSCVCLWSALYFYGLTDEIVEKVWIYVPYEKSSHNSNVKLVRKRAMDWSTGVIQKKGFKITTIERTLVDLLDHKRHISLKQALEICKTALRDGMVSYKNLVIMSEKLCPESRLAEKLVLLS